MPPVERTAKVLAAELGITPHILARLVEQGAPVRRTGRGRGTRYYAHLPRLRAWFERWAGGQGA